MHDTSAAERLGILDGLRGIAIALVVWFHLRLVSGFVIPGTEIVARTGFLGVDLFFFVSGFCIAYPYVRAHAAGSRGPALGEFVRRRVRKIVPSYVLALVVFGLIYHDRFTSAFDEATQFFAHLAFVHVWFPATFGSFSGPLWTLGVEIQFYVVFALSAAAIARRPISAYAVFIAISVAYRVTLALTGANTDFGWLNQLPAVLDVFGAGVFAAALVVRLRPRANAAHVPIATAATLACAVLILFAFASLTDVLASGGDDAGRRWLNAWRVAFGPVLSLGTLGLAFGAASLRSLVNAPPLKWLSLVSYNAYLWNLEVAVGLQNAGLPGWAVFAYGLLGTFSVALLVTHGFERPFMRARSIGVSSELRGFANLLFPRRSHGCGAHDARPGLPERGDGLAPAYEPG